MKKPAPVIPSQESQSVRQSFGVVSEFLTEDVVLALQSAATDDDTWKGARADLHQFLASKGITIPEGLFISVLEAAAPATRIAPPELEHLICPPGTVRTLVGETRRVCTKIFELEFCYYAQVRPPPAPLERVCESRGRVCGRWEDRYEERWYCRLPTLKPAQPGVPKQPGTPVAS
jgi:hypothetical protein